MSKTTLILIATACAFLLMAGEKAMAQAGGAKTKHQIGAGIVMMSPSQADLNSWISSLGVVGTKELGSAYEFFVDYEYRFPTSIFALHFRPSYFMQNASGGGVEAKLSGVTLFPILRLYPLENKFIRFFFQVGLGYGNLTAQLSNPTGGSGTYSGSNFGAVGGLGAFFCITANSCVVAEGNFRYLPMARNTGTGNGLTGGNSSITKENGELELNDSDLATTLSGVQGSLAYQYNF